MLRIGPLKNLQIRLSEFVQASGKLFFFLCSPSKGCKLLGCTHTKSSSAAKPQLFLNTFNQLPVFTVLFFFFLLQLASIKPQTFATKKNFTPTRPVGSSCPHHTVARNYTFQQSNTNTANHWGHTKGSCFVSRLPPLHSPVGFGHSAGMVWMHSYSFQVILAPFVWPLDREGKQWPPTTERKERRNCLEKEHFLWTRATTP